MDLFGIGDIAKEEAAREAGLSEVEVPERVTADDSLMVFLTSWALPVDPAQR